MSIDIIIALLVIVYILVAFIFDLLRPGLILFSAAVVFLATGIISAEEMIKGFSNTGVITIGVLFLVNEGIKQSGLITRLAKAYLPRKKSKMPFLLPRIMIPVSLLSAFLNNLPIVVNVVPILIKWAGLMNLSYKKFLIPLSYAAIFGGMCTLIGTTSNLVVHGLMLENGYKGFHLFEMAKLGLIVAGFGFVYMAFLGNWLLPGERILIRKKKTEVKDYHYNVLLKPESALIGVTVSNKRIDGLGGLIVSAIERQGNVIRPGNGSIRIEAGDELLLTGQADRLNYILAHKEVTLKGIDALKEIPPTELKKYEVVLSPRFPGVGMTLSEFHFFEHFNAAVMAIHRNGERITTKLNEVELKVGDNLVLLATDSFEKNWADRHMFYLVNYVQDMPVEKTSRKKWLAFFILTGMVAGILINEMVSYGFGIRLNIFVMVGIAAVLMVWLGVLPWENYTKNISWDLLIMIASAFAVSNAIKNTGIANALAREFIQTVHDLGPLGVLAILYVFTTLLSEIISNNAAVALVFPVAIVASEMLGVDAKPFFVGIAMAGAASFMTARGYRSNLIIKGIGHYSKGDFFRIGFPLQLLTFLLSVWLIPLIWEF
ncbi:SLC13 family permease [Maribellus sediminis]|uniref:SLC13 family permease n=1 Tax=Maribellus sediminis TaxID=2696285 RepID=UPI00142FCAD7|nr:SLC13 family permease [Maribellus sediminis]